MKILLFLCLASLCSSILVPVTTGQERCMIIYSVNQEDTIKIGMKFPEDASITNHYDYIAEIRDLEGNTLNINYVKSGVFRT
jgi:hypothetical protein